MIAGTTSRRVTPRPPLIATGTTTRVPARQTPTTTRRRLRQAVQRAIIPALAQAPAHR
jgi:hypothetical protein